MKRKLVGVSPTKGKMRPTRGEEGVRFESTEGESGVGVKNRAKRNESGAILILALVYIVAIGLIVGTLADWASSDLDNTGNFQKASNLHYALSSATDSAIESIRYAPYPYQPTASEYQNGTPTPLSECWNAAGGISQLTLDGYTVDTWCTTTINLTSSTATRTVTLFSCVSSTSSASCQASPQLTAQVSFDDYDNTPSLVNQCNIEYPGNSGISGPSSACGYSQKLDYWTWN